MTEFTRDLVKKNFKTDIYFFCLKYLDSVHRSPRDYAELFDWLRFKKVENEINDYVQRMNRRE